MAREGALTLGHDFVGTEYMLLELLNAEAFASAEAF